MSIASRILADLEEHLGTLIPTNVNVKSHGHIKPPLPNNIDTEHLMRTGNKVTVEFYTTRPKDPKPSRYRFDRYGEEY